MDRISESETLEEDLLHHIVLKLEGLVTPNVVERSADDSTLVRY